MKGASEQAVKVDLALRAVAAAEALEADEGDLDAEYDQLAMQSGQKANQIRKAYERNDLVPELAAQIRSKSARLAAPPRRVRRRDGQALDRDLVLGHSHDGDENDDHDHHEAETIADPSETETVST